MRFSFFQQGPTLSITQLIANKTLDAATASLLWLAVENGLSLVTAAGPSLAGKTTLLESSFVFLPPQRQVVVLQGMEEDFSFLEHPRPQESFLYCPEISPHIWFYLWGPKVVRLFEAMAQGYQMGATMHANSPEEVMAQLHRGCGVPALLLSQLNLVAVLRMERRVGQLRRRLASLSELVATEEGLPQARLLTRWDEEPGIWHAVAYPQGLKSKLGETLDVELGKRCQLLESWAGMGLWEPEALRQAILDFYHQNKAASGKTVVR